MTASRIPVQIIDDFGLKPLKSPSDEDLHELMAERYERTATIITSNLDFSEWDQVFPVSIDNLTDLQAMKMPSGQPLELILAIPGRRYSEFVDLLAPVQAPCANAQQEVLHELSWNALRLVVAHEPQAAREASDKRDALIQELEA